jgi:hypothetical protein
LSTRFSPHTILLLSNHFKLQIKFKNSAQVAQTCTRKNNTGVDSKAAINLEGHCHRRARAMKDALVKGEHVPFTLIKYYTRAAQA